MRATSRVEPRAAKKSVSRAVVERGRSGGSRRTVFFSGTRNVRTCSAGTAVQMSESRTGGAARPWFPHVPQVGPDVQVGTMHAAAHTANRRRTISVRASHEQSALPRRDDASRVVVPASRPRGPAAGARPARRVDPPSRGGGADAGPDRHQTRGAAGAIRERDDSGDEGGGVRQVRADCRGRREGGRLVAHDRAEVGAVGRRIAAAGRVSFASV